MSNPSCLVYGEPLPKEAVALLIKGGLISPPSRPPTPRSANPPGPLLSSITPSQSQIWRGLTDRKLNDNQTAVLEIYWRAKIAGEPALSIDAVAKRLTASTGADPNDAANLVKGSLRSFGRRLDKALERIPVKLGTDRQGDGVADEIPLLALMSIETGPSGENRHRLTDDGFVAVDAALGMTAKGYAAGGIQTGDPATDDPDAVVRPAMSRLSHALLLRVQASMDLSFDDTIKALAGLAGAG